MASTTFEAFSLSHSQILDGTQTFLQALAVAAAEGLDVYGVNDSSLDPDTGDYDNEGDDSLLSRWSWINFAEVAVQAGYLSMPLIETLTGDAISSSGSGAAQVFEQELWSEKSMNVAPKPMVVRMPAKDKNGVPRTAAVGLYRVQFKPITFEGMSYKEGMKVNYNGTAVKSPVDEKGQPFADGTKKFGKILSFGA